MVKARSKGGAPKPKTMFVQFILEPLWKVSKVYGACILTYMGYTTGSYSQETSAPDILKMPDSLVLRMCSATAACLTWFMSHLPTHHHHGMHIDFHILMLMSGAGTCRTGQLFCCTPAGCGCPLALSITHLPACIRIIMIVIIIIPPALHVPAGVHCLGCW